MRLLPVLVGTRKGPEFLKCLTTQSGKNRTVSTVFDEEKGFPKTIVESGRLEGSRPQNNREERTVYGARLIEALTKLFFMPGFCVLDDKASDTCLWAGSKTKTPPGNIAEQRMLVMETLMAVVYYGEILGRETLVNPFVLYLSAFQLAREEWAKRFILSLINTGLKIKENGMIPYVSHMYIQETETRTSVLTLSLLSILITREHKIDAIGQALEKDHFTNLIIAAIGEEISVGTGNLPTIDDLKIDHLTKYISLFDDVHTLTVWLTSLYSNIRNPLDYSNTILPLSMKKVGLSHD